MIEEWSKDEDLKDTSDEIISILRSSGPQLFKGVSDRLRGRWELLDKYGFSALYVLIFNTSHPGIFEKRPMGTLTNKDYLGFLRDIIGEGAIISPWSRISRRKYDPYRARIVDTITTFVVHLPKELMKIVEDYTLDVWDAVLFPHHPNSPHSSHVAFKNEVYSCLSFVLGGSDNSL